MKTPMLSIDQIKSVNYDVSGDWAEYSFSGVTAMAVLMYTYVKDGVKRCRAINEHAETIDFEFKDFNILTDAEIAH